MRNHVIQKILQQARLALALAVFILAGSFSASAFTPGDVTTCYNAWWNTFNGQPFGNAYNQFWAGAEIIEMVEDNGNTADITTACNRFTSANGSDWSYNTSNDDVMWAVLAFVRAYTATGNTTYRTYAKNGFDMVYARGYDTSAGGMWWNTTKDYKASCINFPTAIAAKLLSVALGDSSYATKSQNIYNWGKANLWNSSNGQVSDGLHPPSSVDWTSYSYNQGTFIGAAYYNGDSSSVTLAGNYAKNTWGVTLPVYATGGADASGFNGIFVRWLAKSGYDPVWRQAIANNAWGKRNSSNLVNNQWDRVTPNTSQNAWDCSDIVTAMTTVIPDSGVATPYFMLVNKNSGKALDLPNGNSANGVYLQQWTIANNPNQYYYVLPTADNSHFKIISSVDNKCVCVENGSTADNARILQWDYVGNSDQTWDLVDAGNGWFKVKNVNSGKVLDVINGSTADGAPLQQYSDVGSANQQWRLQPVGNYYLRANSRHYVVCSGRGTANGTAIVQYDWEANPWYQWKFTSVSDGWYSCFSQNSGRLICVKGESSTPGAVLNLWDYDPNNTGGQRIRIMPQVNGTFKFYFKLDGQCFDVVNGSTANNAPLQQWTDAGTPQQTFNMERVP